MAALALAVCEASPAGAQGFDETTISFSYADDNLLRDPGETRINSPDAYFGQKATTPLDRYEPSPYVRPQSRLVLSKKLDEGVLSPEGALRVRFTPNESGEYKLADDSSYLRLNYKPNDAYALALTLYPVDADRFRAGYYYDITWGGTNMFPKNFRKGLVPGLKLALDTKMLDAFAGMKTALIRSPSEEILDNPGGNVNQFVERSYLGFLGGAEITLVEGLKVGASGGYFNKATSTRSSVLGKRIDSGGAGGFVAYHRGGDVGRRLDLRLYEQDPEQYPLNSPERYKGEFGFDIGFEYTRLWQTLEDPDNYASTKNESASAAWFGVAARLKTLRLHFDAVYRDLPYIVFNVPGFVPYQAISSEADLSHGANLDFLPGFLSGEMSGVFSVDYYFRNFGFTPAVSLGVLLPATYRPEAEGLKIEGPYASEQTLGIQKVIVRGTNAGDWDILPVGEDELPVFIGKFDLKYNLGANFSAVGEICYARDPNFAQVLIDDHGHAKRRFDEPDILAVGVVTELTF